MRKKLSITTFFMLAMSAMLGCSGDDASTLTHPPLEYMFPMYVTIPGTSAGTGQILKLTAPSTLDGAATVETLLSGLNYPTGIVVSKAGEVYFTEAESTSGRIMKINGTVAEELVTGLNNPQGIILDSTDLIYVIEKGNGQFSRIKSDFTSEVLLTGLSQPRSITRDSNDNFYVTEFAAGKATKIITDGTEENTSTETVIEGLVKPMVAGPGLIGNLFVLSANGEYADGVETLIGDSGNEAYLSGLINPKSAGWEGNMVLYIAEGTPVNRIIKYSQDTGERVVIATLPGDMHSIAFTQAD